MRRFTAFLPVLFALALGLLAPLLRPYVSDFVVKVMILSIFALSLELLVGMTGLVSLGHATFYGIGAYATVLASGAEGGSILGRKIVEVITVNGARVHLEDGSWVLIRASSNKPEMVVVVESMRSADDMRDLFRREMKPRLAAHGVVDYNQEI